MFAGVAKKPQSPPRLTCDCARRIAANIAKLPKLRRHKEG
jgi:hypothetical protein